MRSYLAAILNLSAFPALIGRNFQLIAANVHAAPRACAILTDIEELN